MLTPARLTLLMLLLVAGLVVVYFAKNLWARERPVAVVPPRNMPVPLTDIEPGTEITEQNLGLSPMQVSDLTPDMLANNRVVVGRIAREKLVAGTPIKTTQLYAPGVKPPLEVAEGYHAVTIDIAGAAGILNGLLQPNDRCDVQLTVDGNQDERYRGGIALTLFKRVRILAVNGRVRPAAISQTSNSVTLELTRAQVNIARMAEKRGTITLVSNSANEEGEGVNVANGERVTWEEILQLPPKQEPKAPFTAQIYRRTQRQEIHFLPDNRVRDGGASNERPIPPPTNPDDAEIDEDRNPVRPPRTLNETLPVPSPVDTPVPRTR